MSCCLVQRPLFRCHSFTQGLLTPTATSLDHLSPPIHLSFAYSRHSLFVLSFLEWNRRFLSNLQGKEDMLLDNAKEIPSRAPARWARKCQPRSSPLLLSLPLLPPSSYPPLNPSFFLDGSQERRPSGRWSALRAPRVHHASGTFVGSPCPPLAVAVADPPGLLDCVGVVEPRS